MDTIVYIQKNNNNKYDLKQLKKLKIKKIEKLIIKFKFISLKVGQENIIICNNNNNNNKRLIKLKYNGKVSTQQSFFFYVCVCIYIYIYYI